MKNKIKSLTKSILLKIPYINTKIKRYTYINKVILDAGYEPGHYYSTVPKLDDLKKNQDIIFQEKEIKDIDFNEEHQLKNLDEIKDFYKDYLYHDEDSDLKNYRYKKEGAFYRYSDSVFLYSMIRKSKPKKIIEVGSGHSSAIMLDTNEHFFNNEIEHIFIEPYSERLEGILKEEDYKKNKIIKQNVQNVDLSVFKSLEENDILFIDSTHVSKIASDVNYLFFEVFPVLKPGVLIHFHDIYYSFEYPKKWILEYRYFWNEVYVLRAFLMNNNSYKIEMFNTYLQNKKESWFKTEMPECLKGLERGVGSIWIKKYHSAS